MKNIRLFPLVLTAVLGLAGCVKDDNEVAVPDRDGGLPAGAVPVNLHITAGEATRTWIDGGEVLWSAADRIGIFSPEAYLERKMAELPSVSIKNQRAVNAPFAVSEGADTSWADFAPSSDDNWEYGQWYWDGTVDIHRFYAYYPYGKAALSATKIEAVPFTLPVEQVQSASGDDAHLAALDLTWATAELSRPAEAASGEAFDADLELRFRHLFARVKVVVRNATGESMMLDRVTLSADGVMLSGDYTLDLTTGELTGGQTAGATGDPEAGASAGSVAVRLSESMELSDGAEAVLWMIVPAVDLTAGNASLTVTAAEGEAVFPISVAFEAGGTFAKTVDVTSLESAEVEVIGFESLPLDGDGRYWGEIAGMDDLEVFYRYKFTEGVATFVSWMMEEGNPAAMWCGFAGSDNTLTAVESDYTHQYSVYCGRAHGGENFIVGYYSEYNGPGYEPTVSFAGPREPQRVWIAVNTATYCYITRAEGVFQPQWEEDTMHVVATGYDAEGIETASVRHLVADYTVETPYLPVDWQEFDLSALGAVTRIVFTVESTDTGDYGLNVPTYFCLDDLTLKAE